MDSQILEARIDFHGQALMEKITKSSLILITVVSFLAGFMTQSMQYTFAVFGGATAMLALVVLPPWPMYNSHPPTWLPAIVEPGLVVSKTGISG